jgi:hypothetical protein
MLTPTNFEAQFSDLNRTIAEINQMKSIVDRQMAAAMGGREALPLTGPFELADPALGSIPVSAESYFFVSTLNGNGVCTREVQMTNLGDSLKPTVISQRSGNCSGRSATDIPPHDIAQLQKAGTRLPVEIMPPGKHV